MNVKRPAARHLTAAVEINYLSQRVTAVDGTTKFTDARRRERKKADPLKHRNLTVRTSDTYKMGEDEGRSIGRLHATTR